MHFSKKFEHAVLTECCICSAHGMLYVQRSLNVENVALEDCAALTHECVPEKDFDCGIYAFFAIIQLLRKLRSVYIFLFSK